MKKIQVLCWGVKHIAENHHCEADTNYQDTGEVCIWDADGFSLPAMADVRFLCDDLDIEPSCVECCEFGADIWISREWYDNHANEEYDSRKFIPWKKSGVKIGG